MSVDLVFTTFAKFTSNLRSFLVHFSGCSMRIVMPLVNKASFNAYSMIFRTSLYFPGLNHQFGPPVQCWIGEGGISCLGPKHKHIGLTVSMPLDLGFS